MTKIKQIQTLKSLAESMLKLATDVESSLAGQKPVRLPKGKNIIAKRLKTAIK